MTRITEGCRKSITRMIFHPSRLVSIRGEVILFSSPQPLTQEGKRMASGFIGNEVPRKGLRVRVPCPPLHPVATRVFFLRETLASVALPRSQKSDTAQWTQRVFRALCGAAVQEALDGSIRTIRIDAKLPSVGTHWTSSPIASDMLRPIPPRIREEPR